MAASDSGGRQGVEFPVTPLDICIQTIKLLSYLAPPMNGAQGRFLVMVVVVVVLVVVVGSAAAADVDVVVKVRLRE